MFALDTNVLVRYIVQDDKAQSEKATEIIENLSADSPAFISCIVLCEINWVLKSVYKVSKQERIHVLENFLSVSVFEIEQLESCVRALRRYREGNADFSDYLIQGISHSHGYDTVLTFDKKAEKSEGFSKISC